MCAALFFSQYKNGTTLKYLIIVSLGGFVVFVSDPYPGSTTDDDILEHQWNHVIARLPPSLVVLVDKGTSLLRFSAAAAKGKITFQGPPRKPNGSVFSAKDCSDTSAVANQRIVVENVIGRVSAYFPYVRDKTPKDLIDLAGPTTRVAFFLTNLLVPMTQGSSVSRGDIDDVAVAGKKRRRRAGITATAEADGIASSGDDSESDSFSDSSASSASVSLAAASDDRDGGANASPGASDDDDAVGAAASGGSSRRRRRRRVQFAGSARDDDE